MEAKNLALADIRVGDMATFSRTWEESDVQLFAKVSGDFNPLHMDGEYAGTTKFKGRIVHGLLVASLCSTLVGMYLPGKKCLYLGQTLLFKKPVYINDTVVVLGTVISKSESTRIITLSVVMKKGEEIVLEGEARAQVL